MGKKEQQQRLCACACVLEPPRARLKKVHDVLCFSARFTLTRPQVRVLVDVDSSPQPYAEGQSADDVMSGSSAGGGAMDGNALV